MFNAILDGSQYKNLEVFDGESIVGNKLMKKYSSGLINLAEEFFGENQQPGICILMERSADYIAVILSAWHAGFYVVPLNTSWPVEKNLDIIKRIKPAVVLVDDGFDSALVQGVNFVTKEVLLETPCDPKACKRSLKPCDIAYIIFTSGSTGEPKGVVISASSFRSYMDWTKRHFNEYKNSKKLLLTSELTFDITMGDIAFALAFGTHIGVARYNTNIPSVLAMIMQHQIDVLYSVPTTHLALSTFAKKKRGADLSSLKLILSGGDRFPWQLVDDYKKLTNGAHFYNVYGPTEVTINCFSIRLDDKNYLSDSGAPVPIGYCFDSLDYLLLDENGDQAKEGELCITGPQIMMGYHNDSELTKKALTTDPRLSSVNRLVYRTGDLAYSEEGVVYLKGRIDGLVKIRGYRIHPDEISKALDTCPGVVASAAVAYGAQSEAALAVFLQLEKDSDLLAPQVEAFLRSKVPEYMIPDRIVFIDEFPLNQSGKIDKKVLTTRLI